MLLLVFVFLVDYRVPFERTSSISFEVSFSITDLLGCHLVDACLTEYA